MEDAVRALLSSRGVRLETTAEQVEIPEFVLLGIAEKTPEIGGLLSETNVHVWHIESGMMPLSRADFERWCVDAPIGKNWILSERELPDGCQDDTPHGVELVIWGPEVLSRWIGDAVISGELVARAPTIEPEEKAEPSSDIVGGHDEYSLVMPAIVSLDSWLIQSGREGSMTSPVLLKVALWKISGFLIGPDGEELNSDWEVIEDPWASSLSINEVPLGDNNIRIRTIDPPISMWRDESSLMGELPSILDRKIQGDDESKDGPVRSIMLQWWRTDIDSLKKSRVFIGMPGWIVESPGRERVVLHGGNGRTYPFN